MKRLLVIACLLTAAGLGFTVRSALGQRSRDSDPIAQIPIVSTVPQVCHDPTGTALQAYKAARRRSREIYDDLQKGKCDFKVWQAAVHDEYEAQRQLERLLDR